MSLDLRATLDRLGLSQADLGRLIACSRRDVVNRWATGKNPLPHWLPSWLAMYEMLTDEQRVSLSREK